MLILLIQAYRMVISPYLGQMCRFQPTCSHYATEAIEMHGVCRGVWLAIRRIGRCHPWGGSGHDPVPGMPVRLVAARANGTLSTSCRQTLTPTARLKD